MKFLDEAKIFVKAGDGGDGALSFRREKFVEFGGPDGGMGGNGGSVRIRASRNVNTLIDYRYQQHFKAKRGENGRGQNKTGKSGDDIELIVPVGTQILDGESLVPICDLIEENQIELLAQGGKGGLGNAYFKTSTNQAPRYHQKGSPGEERWLWLKLKLVADIGLIGLPNAGKSTLISALTNAKAKAASYAFTTLNPQLGVLRRFGKDLVLADMPGLIEGAHLGRGLGEKFLKHIERCSMLLHLIDGTDTENILNNYRIIRNELMNYSSALAAKPEIIVLNKIDAIPENDLRNIMQQLASYGKIIPISAISRLGLETLINTLFE